MRQILAVALVVMAGQAQALSCMPSDISRTFNWVSDAQERFIILSGVFSFDAPETIETNQFEPASTSHEATFEGQYLGAEGFVVAPPLNVTLNFNCLGPWCGSIGDGEDDILVFAEQTPQGYVVNVDPCFSGVFASTDENIARVESCIRGEGCDEIPF